MTELTSQDSREKEESLIIHLECQLFEPETRLSAKEINNLLFDDFFEITSTGRRYFKDEALTRLPQETPPTIQAVNYRVKWLEHSVALLTYRSILKRENSEVIYSLRTSIWQKDGNNWKMRFHQGTPCAPFSIDD